ncbi:TPA: hypothetical protein ACHIFS_004694 [Bacillus paranthracis]
MYQIHYRRWDNRIELISDEGEKKFLTHSISSRPLISPNKSQALYLSPYEWETYPNLYLMNLSTGENISLINSTDKQSVPKDTVWITDTCIAIIIGPIFDQMNDGGNVFILDLITRNLKQITEWDYQIQAIKLKYYQGNLEVDCYGYVNGLKNKCVEFKKKIAINLYIN